MMNVSSHLHRLIHNIFSCLLNIQWAVLLRLICTITDSIGVTVILFTDSSANILKIAPLMFWAYQTDMYSLMKEFTQITLRSWFCTDFNRSITKQWSPTFFDSLLIVAWFGYKIHPSLKYLTKIIRPYYIVIFSWFVSHQDTRIIRRSSGFVPSPNNCI